MDQLIEVLQSRKLKSHSEITKDLRSSLLRLEPKIETTWFEEEDQSLIKGRCDNWFGWLQVPVGVAGPMNIDGKMVVLPMATTEGALIASVCRGCKAVSQISTICLDDQMTRGPVFKIASISSAAAFEKFICDSYDSLRTAFESCSRHCKLIDIEQRVMGRYAFLRFSASTDEAMGMNMVTICTEAACSFLVNNFEGMVELVSLSGNFCIDKKASTVNILKGRGKYVVAECVIPKGAVESVLKTSVDMIVRTCLAKCWYGSSIAGAIGGNNAHAANIVAAAFMATGQDVAQVVESSACFTTMEKDENGDLVATVTMPCLEVGTVGGGTLLPTQNACLCLALKSFPDEKDSAVRLARIICAFVLAGEVSLLASLSEGSLVKAHLKLNRA